MMNFKLMITPVLLLILSTTTLAYASVSDDFLLNQDNEESHMQNSSPDEETRFFENFSSSGTSIEMAPETRLWNEKEKTGHNNSLEKISGIYVDYQARATNRQISPVLFSYLNYDDKFKKCINEALNELGLPEFSSIDIGHDGIMGDKNHIKKGGSLHNIFRAIDIDHLKIVMKNGKTKVFDYENEKGAYVGKSSKGHNVYKELPFWNSLRTCWGEIIHYDAQCPLNDGGIAYTGSIGREDWRHTHHLHFSVPICKSGDRSLYQGKRYFSK